jgi:hypothetical protein
MSTSSRTKIVRFLYVAAGLLLAACQSAAPVAQVVPTAVPQAQVIPTITPVAVVQVAASAVPSATNTQVPDTPTAVPTNTNTPTAIPPTATASPTVAPTDTPTLVPPTATAKPTAKPTARPQPTSVPPTVAPTQPPVPASIYSTATGGPQGYVSILGCTQPGNVPCQSVMAPGDKAFSIKLVALDDAVPAIFVPFGLAVEKDGANVADMYMTVVSGWLNPGEYALLGTSRNFTQPGHYVIRTNGCYVTRETYPQCNWGTVDGTIVTFDIQ